jgi:hypothetical protein
MMTRSFPHRRRGARPIQMRGRDALRARRGTASVCMLAAALGAWAAAGSDVAQASAAHAENSQTAACIVRSLPSFTAQGEGSLMATVADVVEVECNPALYGPGSKVKLTAYQLYWRCREQLTWYVPTPFHAEQGAGISVELDADANATVALRAGPGCAAGESLITAHQESLPYDSFSTAFNVEPPGLSEAGVRATPPIQVENVSSAVATVVQAELPGLSEAPLHIASEELYHRCRIAPHLHWVLMDGTVVSDTPEVEGVQLDDDGNAFVIALGDRSCAQGSSLIEADLEENPFSTYLTNFAIEPPQPTGEPAFTIEKLQQIAGSGTGFTRSQLRGEIGQTVEYQMSATNTGSVAEMFGELQDPHCDADTLDGGPGAGALAPGQTTTWSCRHVLTQVGEYSNEATVTASAAGGMPLTQSSNRVIVEVPPPPAPEPSFTIEKTQQIAGSGAGFTSATLTGAIGETVEYRISVANTGNVPLALSGFNDPYCAPGTIAGGPGEAQVAPGGRTVYTCTHLLSATGPYVNVAEVTATPPGESALPSLPSNKVEVDVAAENEFGTTTSGPSPVETSMHLGSGGVRKFCATKPPKLRGASGAKRRPFTVQLGAAGVKKVTFYLDGRKLETLSHSHAKHGKFSVRVDPRKLSYGAHHISIKAVMSNSSCASVARAGVFVHAAAQRSAVKFTG